MGLSDVYLCGVWLHIYGIHSGRAEYCWAFLTSLLVSHIMYNSLKLLRTGFFIFFILAGIAILIKTYKSTLRPFILTLFLWIISLLCVYTLLVSKCRAKFYLISGLFLSMLWLMCIWLVILFKDSKKSNDA